MLALIVHSPMSTEGSSSDIDLLSLQAEKECNMFLRHTPIDLKIKKAEGIINKIKVSREGVTQT